MNVSQNGMQLQCDADGRLLTFKDGDSVDVHLTIKHEGKTRKIAIPSWVRHVEADSIDVEFHKPDPVLVDLIESYRVSEQHKLEASLGRLDRRGTSSRATANLINEKLSGQAAKHAQKQNNRPFYSVILATVFAVCVITGGYVYTASIDSRINTLETLSKRQSTELADIQSRVFSASLQEGRYASLNARMTALNDAFVSLEGRLGQVIPPSASAPGRKARTTDSVSREPGIPAAASGPATAAADGAIDQAPAQPDLPKPTSPAMADTVEKPAARPSKPPVAGDALATITRAAPQITDREETGSKVAPEDSQGSITSDTPASSKGPWVINLISSPDKAYVERFSNKSGAANQDAELNSATVKGRKYWRLQIAGFESYTAARKHAETVKQELGIKDVWIFRQK